MNMTFKCNRVPVRISRHCRMSGKQIVACARRLASTFALMHHNAKVLWTKPRLSPSNDEAITFTPRLDDTAQHVLHEKNGDAALHVDFPTCVLLPSCSARAASSGPGTQIVSPAIWRVDPRPVRSRTSRRSQTDQSVESQSPSQEDACFQYKFFVAPERFKHTSPARCRTRWNGFTL